MAKNAVPAVVDGVSGAKLAQLNAQPFVASSSAACSGAAIVVAATEMGVRASKEDVGVVERSRNNTAMEEAENATTAAAEKADPESMDESVAVLLVKEEVSVS